ncbi:MAG: 4a-hydroxytetrahydrobiopterin dehydratase [Gemmataceae bacterium]|nr:4a-hydroxytetrahydrobiopterin dehydratase [Gemmataceae bacterium]
MSDLADRRCAPCSGATPVLPQNRARELLAGVPGWQLSDDGRRLVRGWRAADFPAALAFFGRVGEVAEAEGHHPDLHLTDYRDVRLELWTHAAGGLTENDFILAAKIDRLPGPEARNDE